MRTHASVNEAEISALLAILLSPLGHAEAKPIYNRIIKGYKSVDADEVRAKVSFGLVKFLELLKAGAYEDGSI